MARRLLSAVARTLRAAPDQHVHFHNDGSPDQPAPCFDSGCQRPRLDLRAH